MNANAMLSSIQQYWNRRAPSYTEVILKNLAGQWESVWANELIRNFPEGKGLRVLDIGTGPGFYAIILAKRGYQVTAVDYSEGMLEEAKQNAGTLADRITFRQMDAHHLDFPDNSFDVIVTRNLTWNLADPVRAYADWQRVLVPGGVMTRTGTLIFSMKKRRKNTIRIARTHTWPAWKIMKATRMPIVWSRFPVSFRWGALRARSGIFVY